MIRPRLRRAAAVLGFCVLVVAGRVSYDSSGHFRAGRALEETGELHEAAVRYGRAVHMYLPLLPVPRMASERLVALAEAAQDRGDPAEARFCWEELRSGWLAVRSMWQPGARYVAQAEDAIATLILDDPRGTWPEPSAPRGVREEAVRARLAEREAPRTGWVLAMGLGWGLWLGAATVAILRGVPRDDDAPFQWRPIRRWALVSAGGYVLWLVALAAA